VISEARVILFLIQVLFAVTMRLFSNFSKSEKSTPPESPQQDVEKTGRSDGTIKTVPGDKTDIVDDFSVAENVQAGVQAVEAATSVWTKGHLITAYIMYVEQIWCSFSILQSNLAQDLADLFHCLNGGGCPSLFKSLCYQLILSAQLDRCYGNHGQYHRRIK